MRPGPELDFAAPPAIAQIWLSSLVLQRGTNWDGQIATSTNAASIEVRTDSFSFSVPRVRSGIFAFSYAIPDLPPYLRRHFALHVVARNAAGDKFDESYRSRSAEAEGSTVPVTSPRPTAASPSPQRPLIVTVSPSSRNARCVPSSRASGCAPRHVSSIMLP